MKKEITGIFIFFLATFMFFGFLSYSPSDPSFNNAVSSVSIKNYTGIIGAYFCGSLYDFFGTGALWIPGFLFLKSYFIFRNKDFFLKGLMGISGFFVLIISTGTLTRSSFFKIPEYPLVTGFLREFLEKYLNEAGSLIFLFFIFIAGFMFATGLRFGFFLSAIKSFFKYLKLFYGKTLLFFSEYLRKKKEKKEKEKIYRLESSAPSKVIKEEKKVKPKPFPVKKVVKTSENINLTDKNKNISVPYSFLSYPENEDLSESEEEVKRKSEILVNKLTDFGIKGEVVSVSKGPVVTTFEYKPAPGIKISRVANLSDDLALVLKALSIRIVAPIPGKSVIGIEVPNQIRSSVYCREILATDEFIKSKSPLSIGLGKDIEGTPVVVSLEKMPHLLIAGATGAGKSVCLNMMITSFLYKASPDEVKMIMIDPKRIELSVYQGIPHLMTPVVTDMKKAKNVLFWAVREMERRYEL